MAYSCPYGPSACCPPLPLVLPNETVPVHLALLHLWGLASVLVRDFSAVNFHRLSPTSARMLPRSNLNAPRSFLDLPSFPSRLCPPSVCASPKCAPCHLRKSSTRAASSSPDSYSPYSCG